MEKTKRYIALQLPLFWNQKERAFSLLEEHLSRITSPSSSGGERSEPGDLMHPLSSSSGKHEVRRPGDPESESSGQPSLDSRLRGNDGGAKPEGDEEKSFADNGREKLATIVVLPEAYLTGYVSPFGEFDVRPFAEPLSANSHQTLCALAKRYQVALAAPLIEKEGRRFFNSMLFIDEEGSTLAHYRKRHPWLPERWATAGDLGMPVFSWRGISVTMAICFDLHFLEKECAHQLREADLLLFSSVWVEEEKDTRTPQLQHLAKKFSLHVINANWARSNPYVPSQGGSVIISKTGDILARASDASPQMVQSLSQ